jgi:hypothetical protein
VANGLIGTLVRHQGDLVTASALYHESLRIGWVQGGQVRLHDWLIGLGSVEIRRGETAGEAFDRAERSFFRGTRLFGAVDALLEGTGGVIWAHDRADYNRCVTVARAALGEAAFAAAWAEGRALSLDQAYELALADSEHASR